MLPTLSITNLYIQRKIASFSEFALAIIALAFRLLTIPTSLKESAIVATSTKLIRLKIRPLSIFKICKSFFWELVFWHKKSRKQLIINYLRRFVAATGLEPMTFGL